MRHRYGQRSERADDRAARAQGRRHRDGQTGRDSGRDQRGTQREQCSVDDRGIAERRPPRVERDPTAQRHERRPEGAGEGSAEQPDDHHDRRRERSRRPHPGRHPRSTSCCQRRSSRGTSAAGSSSRASPKSDRTYGLEPARRNRSRLAASRRERSRTVGWPRIPGSALVACSSGLNRRLAMTCAPAARSASAGMTTNETLVSAPPSSRNGRAERANWPRRTPPSTKLASYDIAKSTCPSANSSFSSASLFGSARPSRYISGLSRRRYANAASSPLAITTWRTKAEPVKSGGAGYVNRPGCRRAHSSSSSNVRGGSGTLAESCAYTNTARLHGASCPSMGTWKSRAIVGSRESRYRAFGSVGTQSSSQRPALLPAAKFSPLIQIRSTAPPDVPPARRWATTRCTASAVSDTGTRRRRTPRRRAAGAARTSTYAFTLASPPNIHHRTSCPRAWAVVASNVSDPAGEAGAPRQPPPPGLKPCPTRGKAQHART